MQMVIALEAQKHYNNHNNHGREGMGLNVSTH